MKKKKVLFCYFAKKMGNYTPTDIGYVLAIINQERLNAYDFDVVELNYCRSKTKENEDDYDIKNIRIDVDLIEYHKPDAVFIFLENVLWSKVFALGRSRKIIKEIRSRQSKVFIGLQSYKINTSQISSVLDNNSADCVITGDPETVFSYLDEMLEKKFLPGVEYKNNNYPKGGLIKLLESFEKKSCNITDELDTIPSPYLNHIFDNHIQVNQKKYGGQFRAFLVSSRGCSFGCYYCFRSTKFEKVRYFSVARFYNELEYLFTIFAVRKFFILDDAFLCSVERLKEFETEFRCRLVINPDLENIELFIMARPEEINEEVVRILSFMKVKTIQIGLQTVNPALQHYMRRGVDVLYFKNIKEWLQKYDIKLYLDIVVGLPGDSVAWMSETLRYALLLDPIFLQIKQFYLNPSTLFDFNQLAYGIEIDQKETDFNAPYVIKAKNIDDGYFEGTNNFILEQIKNNPSISWRYLSKKASFLSTDVFKMERQKENLFYNYYNVLWSLKRNNLDKKMLHELRLTIDNEKIYFDDGDKTFFAIHQINGKIAWKYKINSFSSNRNFFLAPIIYDGLVYFGLDDANLYCLDSETGKLIWVSMEADWINSSFSFCAELGSLFVSLEAGFLNKKGVVMSLDLKTGKKNWQSSTNKEKCSSTLYIPGKNMVVAANTKGFLFALSAKTGEIIWTQFLLKGIKGPVFFDSNTSLLFCGSSNGNVCVLSPDTGKVLYSFNIDVSGALSSLCFHEGCAIFVDTNNIISSINLKNKTINWKFSMLQPSEILKIKIIDSNVFFESKEGNYYELDFKTGKQLSCTNSNDCDSGDIVYNPKSKRYFVISRSGGIIALVKQSSSHFFIE